MKRTSWALAAALAAILGGNPQSPGQDAPADAGALFLKLDKNGDGKLTAGEIPEEQVRFFDRLVRRGDKNSDGELSREEFEQASKPEERPNVPLGPAGAGDQGRGGDARQRFEMLDRNKDGKVTLDEVPEPLRDRVKPLFERSGKQELTFDDFNRMRGAGQPEPGELFKRMDANSDGKLTKDEIPAGMRENLAPIFERAGKNELSHDEFLQFAGQMRGGRPGQPAEGRPGGNPEEVFGRLDTNGDGQLKVDEAPERARPMVEGLLRRIGKGPDASLSKDEFVRNFPAPMPRDGDRKPEADRPRDGERRPDGEKPRDGERRPETADRPRDGERKPEGDRPRDGERRPEAGDRPRDGQRGRGPVFFRLLDENHDGRLSKDELAKASEKFDQLDQNHDGQLDMAEVLGGPPPAPPEGRNPPRDGVSRDGVPPTGRGDGTRREPNPAGEARRTAGDAGGRERRPETPAPFFQRLDKDGDGKISKDEAPEQMKERFGMLDTNGDGFVSLDEFRAGAQVLGDRLRNRADGRPETPRRD